MRICFASDQAFPAVGGEGISTQNLSLGMAKKGHKVIVLTSHRSGLIKFVFRISHIVHRKKKTKKENQITKYNVRSTIYDAKFDRYHSWLEPSNRAKGIRIYRFFSLPLPGQKGSLAFPSLIKITSILKRERIDLIHINLPSYLGWQTLKGARKIGIPVVLGFHVQVGNVIPSYFPFSLFKGVLETWFTYFYSKADTLVAPSHLASEILKKYTHKPIRVVSNGIDLGLFNLEKITSKEIEAFKKRYSLAGFSVLLYTGRLSYEKNINYLLRIMQALKKRKQRVKLLITGEGSLKNRLEKRAARLGMKKEVSFTGFLREKNFLCAYACANIFILASFYELQSIATLEAMAMRKAILIGRSKENAAQELVKEGANGYTFSLEDPGEAIEKINKILSNEKLRKSMEEKSYQIVQAHVIEKSISKLEGIYKSLIN